MDQSTSSSCYPEIDREPSTNRLLELQQEFQQISDQIYDLLQTSIDASGHCDESSFYRISCNNEKAYRLSLRMSGLLMEASSLGSNLVRIVGRIRTERNEQKRGR